MEERGVQLWITISPGVSDRFDIEVPTGTRTWQLRAADATEQAKWIELINKIVKKSHFNKQAARRENRGACDAYGAPYGEW